jgi:hypothetical protein
MRFKNQFPLPSSNNQINNEGSAADGDGAEDDNNDMIETVDWYKCN